MLEYDEIVDNPRLKNLLQKVAEAVQPCSGLAEFDSKITLYLFLITMMATLRPEELWEGEEKSVVVELRMPRKFIEMFESFSTFVSGCFNLAEGTISGGKVTIESSEELLLGGSRAKIETFLITYFLREGIGSIADSKREKLDSLRKLFKEIIEIGKERTDV